MPQKILILPTYNEIESLPVIVSQIRQIYPSFPILVVDDNSPDGTGKLADDFAKKDSNFHVMHRTAKEGLGAAYIAAFGWCIENGYELAFQMDVDGSHRVIDLPKLVDRLEGDGDLDLVIGSRYVRGGGTEGWGPMRKLLSESGNVWARFWLKLPFKDCTAGFRGYRTSAFTQKMDFAKIDNMGFGFQIDMTFNLFNGGGRIAEVPILFKERDLGQSKMGSNIIFEALISVMKKGISFRLNKGERNAR